MRRFIPASSSDQFVETLIHRGYRSDHDGRCPEIRVVSPVTPVRLHWPDFKDSNANVIIQGLTVGTTGSDITLNSTSITSGQTVTINSGKAALRNVAAPY
jgi:hypothetical protein